MPRVRTGYEGYVRPSVEQAKSLARSAGDSAERTLGNALGSVFAIGDIANDVLGVPSSASLRALPPW